jgi:hypothetical protein
LESVLSREFCQRRFAIIFLNKILTTRCIDYLERGYIFAPHNKWNTKTNKMNIAVINHRVENFTIELSNILKSRYGKMFTYEVGQEIDERIEFLEAQLKDLKQQKSDLRWKMLVTDKQ